MPDRSYQFCDLGNSTSTSLDFSVLICKTEILIYLFSSTAMKILWDNRLCLTCSKSSFKVAVITIVFLKN